MKCICTFILDTSIVSIQKWSNQWLTSNSAHRLAKVMIFPKFFHLNSFWWRCYYPLTGDSPFSVILTVETGCWVLTWSAYPPLIIHATTLLWVCYITFDCTWHNQRGQSWQMCVWNLVIKLRHSEISTGPIHNITHIERDFLPFNKCPATAADCKQNSKWLLTMFRRILDSTELITGYNKTS